MNNDSVSTHIYPGGMLRTLSRSEAGRLQQASKGELAVLLRRCALAVLNSGSSSKGDDVNVLMDRYRDFSIDIQVVNRGLRLEIKHAPASAFVDGQIIAGFGDLLSAVIRDLVYFDIEIKSKRSSNLQSSEGITNSVFEILRNADVIYPQLYPELVVCWGGHSISQQEYTYAKECGYQLGLRRLNICTGCGHGAMKGPMKGATIAHMKQRIAPGHYIGISEPGIIAAEPPNPIVSQLVIMPDIEKRLEAFIRLGHGIIVFPGGVGTLEEVLFLLGILMKPENKDLPFPLVFTGPAGSADYFWQIDAFLRLAFGKQASERYQIVIDDPVKVAQIMVSGLQQVRDYRETNKDAFYFNWQINIDESFQIPFMPTHENMLNLRLYRDMPAYELAANLRKIFSGIVAGNVKPAGLAAVKKHGLYEICGEKPLMESLDVILESFVNQQRMKLPSGHSYDPCYRIVSG